MLFPTCLCKSYKFLKGGVSFVKYQIRNIWFFNAGTKKLEDPKRNSLAKFPSNLLKKNKFSRIDTKTVF